METSSNLLIYFFIFIWMIPVTASAIWAKLWGRPAIGFFFLALFGTPVIAFLVLLIAGEPKKQCPFCLSKINRKAIVCPKCQRDQPIENTVDQKQKTDTPTPPTIS